MQASWLAEAKQVNSEIQLKVVDEHEKNKLLHLASNTQL